MKRVLNESQSTLFTLVQGRSAMLNASSKTAAGGANEDAVSSYPPNCFMPMGYY